MSNHTPGPWTVSVLEALRDLLDDLQMDMLTAPAGSFRMIKSGRRIEQARAAIAAATADGASPEDRPSPFYMSARESAIDEQVAMYDDHYDDQFGE